MGSGGKCFCYKMTQILKVTCLLCICRFLEKWHVFCYSEPGSRDTCRCATYRRGNGYLWKLLQLLNASGNTIEAKENDFLPWVGHYLAVTGSKTGILIRAACTTAVTGLAVRVAHVAPGTSVTAHPSEAGFAMTGPRCQT